MTHKLLQGENIEKATQDDGPDVPVSVMGLSAKDRKIWWDVKTQQQTDARYARNYQRIKEAQTEFEREDRKKRVLLISTSGRNNKDSCAHEEARSNKVIRDLVQRFTAAGCETAHHDLWDLNIEHCNGCYGTEDYWCHWPCTCWPFDDGQVLYEEIVKADAIVIGSPVNEASMTSRFTQFWHRCICVDGGLDFKPPAGWTKSVEKLASAREERGHAEGIPFVQRFLGKPFAILVLGHEIGAQTAASQTASSVQYRGAYVPAHCLVPMHYVGSGPNAQDREKVKGEGPGGKDFKQELDHSLDAVVASLMRDIGLNRDNKPVKYVSDRT